MLLIKQKLVDGQETHKKQKLHLLRNLEDSQKQRILILDSLVLLNLVQMKRNLKENLDLKELLQEKTVHLFVDHQEMSPKVILDLPVLPQKKNLQASHVLVLILKKKTKRRKKRKDQSLKLMVKDLDLGILMQQEVLVVNDLF